jgi:hypothetical protein|tara:strand:- start:172 stop:945 length:774 start_codon:yes stop_codon:yes gene_type:complete
MEETKEKTPKVKKDTWEYKDRHYYLTGNKEPLTYTIPSRHTRKYPLTWFDPEIGYERELRYATNQKSIFVDEQQGNVTLSHIVFENGSLHVPKEKRSLQEFLNHHPHKGIIFQELDKQVEAVDQLEYLELESDAMTIARQMDIDQMEAILRVEMGSQVSKLSTKELKRDLLLFARQNPGLFLNLAQDENIILRNFAINAREAGIIDLSPDQKTFKWASNGRKLMTVPFDENPYSAMAAWFKTDEGLEVYKSIEKKLK